MFVCAVEESKGKGGEKVERPDWQVGCIETAIILKANSSGAAQKLSCCPENLEEDILTWRKSIKENPRR